MNNVKKLRSKYSPRESETSRGHNKPFNFGGGGAPMTGSWRNCPAPAYNQDLTKKPREFSDVLSELTNVVSAETGKGSYYNWISKRVKDLSYNHIGNFFPTSQMDHIRDYNYFALNNSYANSNDKTYTRSFVSDAENLNSFDNSHRVMVNYTGKLLMRGLQIKSSDFSRIWKRREYLEHRKFINIFNPNYVAIWRSGVIPYVQIDGIVYYGFAHDTAYITRSDENIIDYNLSDFGGGTEVGESAVLGAIREWCEESLGLFHCYKIPGHSIVSFYRGVAIYFVNVFDPTKNAGFEPDQFPGNIGDSLIKNLKEKLKKWGGGKKPADFPEVGGMSWLNAHEIMTKIKSTDDDPFFYETIIPNISSIDHIEKLIVHE